MNTCCICQIIKDEHDYIEEWIEYHHNLGVEKFYLIEDIGSETHSEILKKYDYVELYKLEEVIAQHEREMLENGIYRQKIVYEVFRRKWINNHDFLIFIDVDEYLELTKESLQVLLQSGEQYPYIMISWKAMKCDGNLLHPNSHKKYSIVDTYKTYNFRIRDVKPIINCRKEFQELTSGDNFTFFPHQFKRTVKFLYSNVYIRHYLCKSFEEWVTRLTKKGEIEKADWNRKFDDWFRVNPEYLDYKELLMEKFKCDDSKIKYNDYIKTTAYEE